MNNFLLAGCVFLNNNKNEGRKKEEIEINNLTENKKNNE